MAQAHAWRWLIPATMLAVASSLGQATRQTDGTLPPLPKGPEVAAARQAVLNELKADLALDGPAMRARACDKFISIAAASGGDAARRCAALSECQRFAEGHGMAGPAAAAIEEMARWWAFPKYERLKKCLEAVSANSTTRDQREAVVSVARTSALQASTIEKWDAAAELIRVAELAAERSGNRLLTAEVAAESNTIEAGRKQSADIAQYERRLAADPNDVKANQAMGEYLCVARRQLGRGMVYLSRGAAGPMRDAAAAELENAMGMGKGAHQSLATMWAAAAMHPATSKTMREVTLGLVAHHDMEALPELTPAERVPAVMRLTQWVNTHVAAGQTYGVPEPDPAWKRLGRVRFFLRDEADDLQTHQGQLQIERLPGKDELPAARFVMHVCAADPTGKVAVFKSEGKVVWPKEAEKPARLTGPKKKVVKDFMPPKSRVVAAHVRVEIEGTTVYQAISSVPIDQPWWLMPDLLAGEK